MTKDEGFCTVSTKYEVLEATKYLVIMKLCIARSVDGLELISCSICHWANVGGLNYVALEAKVQA